MSDSPRDLFYPSGKKFSDAEEKAFAREDLIFNVTEDLLIVMEDLNVSKADLAKKLSKSKSYVTQVLSGARNMTLGSFSDICFALGVKPEIKINSLSDDAKDWISEAPYNLLTLVSVNKGAGHIIGSANNDKKWVVDRDQDAA